MSAFRAICGATVVLALSITTAAAQTTLSGTYTFRTHAMKDGAPVCTEKWSFGSDGVWTVESGQEVVHAKFTLTHDRVGDWIVSTTIDTNHKPDCVGKARTSVPTEPDRTYWFATNDGTINICAPPQTEPVIYIGNCYATLEREPAP